jgi:hypothetical protein
MANNLSPLSFFARNNTQQHNVGTPPGGTHTLNKEPMPMTTTAPAPGRTRRLSRLSRPIGPSANAPPANDGDVIADINATALLTPASAAGRLATTAKVLERWRSTGDGPRFVRLTKKTIRYRAADVEAFIASRVRASTAAG